MRSWRRVCKRAKGRVSYYDDGERQAGLFCLFLTQKQTNKKKKALLEGGNARMRIGFAEDGVDNDSRQMTTTTMI